MWLHKILDKPFSILFNVATVNQGMDMAKNCTHYIQGDMTNKVRNFVTERFISERKYSTVKEIAAGLGASEATVRKVLKNNPSGVRYERESRESHSRNFPSMSVGAHYVDSYGPSMDHLAKIIKDIRSST